MKESKSDKGNAGGRPPARASEGTTAGGGTAAPRRPRTPSGGPDQGAEQAAGTPGRRGRPPGSVSLTREIFETIIGYIRAGAFACVAAEAAGVGERTFHDWMARGEGRHPSRRPTPKLRELARAVRKAQAEARLGAEVAVYREHPRYWLSHVARSRPGREGWTDPPAGLGEPVPLSDRKLVDARERLAARLDQIAARQRAPRRSRDEGHPPEKA